MVAAPTPVAVEVQVGLAAVLVVLAVDKLHTLPALETMAEMAVGVVADAFLLEQAVQAWEEEEQAEVAAIYVALRGLVEAGVAVHMVPAVAVHMVLGDLVAVELQALFV